ncbi:MAG: Rieske 2Fe-2S domain-containing protein [Actinomycetota bacterium]
MTGWSPVATAEEVVPGHVVRSQVNGRGLVIWRGHDGYVNVWENRCLHRGVRLSIGSTDGTELVCRYHGWRYANRTAGCTYIPAHPADSPARTIHATTYPAVERFGLIWTDVERAASGPPAVDELADDVLVLRPLPVNAPVHTVVAALEAHRFAVDASQGVDAVGDDVATTALRVESDRVVLCSESARGSSIVVFFVQALEDRRSVIRPVLAGSPADPMPVWRHHASMLRGLVEALEREVALDPASGPAVESSVALPVGRAEQVASSMTVRVARKWATAASIAAFELEPLPGEALPTAQAGDHIDVHLADGLVRQYSLTNGPGETDRYRIGVKLEPDSRGGSRAMHADVRVGDELRISPPRNNFPLQRNVPTTLLIAGGIGVTPILSMAQVLATMDLDFALHYFAAGPEHLAFPEVLEALGGRVHRHLSLSPAETAEELTALLATPDPTVQVYACGPPPMLSAIRAIAADAGWPDEAVRFEYFENTTEIDDSSTFTVELARSALTLEVPAGSSILETVRASGVALSSSCEQGACGTCAVTVLDGEPLHQDVYLTAAERSAGERMLTCVSRARSDRLVLDL